MIKSILLGRRLRILSAVSLTLLGSSCWASVIYTNFGPGQTFVPISGYYVGPHGGSDAQTIAVSFTPASQSTLTSVSFAATAQTGYNVFSLMLSQDAGGAPGGAIEDFGILALPTTQTVTTLNSILSPTLNANTKYWLLLSAPASIDGTSVAAWYTNPISATGLDYQNYGSSNWNANNVGLSPVFEIDGNIITGGGDNGGGPIGGGDVAPNPEPATVGLIFSGLALVVGIRYRRK